MYMPRVIIVFYINITFKYLFFITSPPSMPKILYGKFEILQKQKLLNLYRKCLHSCCKKANKDRIS